MSNFTDPVTYIYDFEEESYLSIKQQRDLCIDLYTNVNKC